MIFATNNKYIIKKLTKRTMRANRLRNAFVITAVALTAFLITTIFSIGFSTIESLKLQQLRVMGTTAHVALSYPTEDQIKKVEKLDYIEQIGVQSNVGSIKSTPSMGNMVLGLHWFGSSEWDIFRKPTISNFIGTYPQKYDEIMVPDWILNRMGITNPELGMILEIEYRTTINEITSEYKTQKFVLSAYYTEYMNLHSDNVGVMLVSEEFMKKQGVSPVNSGAASIRFKNTSDINAQVEKLAKDIHLNSNQKIKVVPIYDRSDFADTATLIGLAGIILVIMLSGYLLIYNVFSLSVSRDIRYYGLLKTIGTTPAQLKKIVIGQAMRLAGIGIPLGLAAGAIVSLIAVPSILTVMINHESGVKVSFSPLIYGGAVIFTGLTTLWAANKPAKKAGSISPIEANRFTGMSSTPKQRESSNGSKAGIMALRNIFRNKKRSMVVFASLFLGITSFLAVNTILLSMDTDNLVADYIENDFRLTNNTLNPGLENGVKQKFDDSFLADLKNINGITDFNQVTCQEVNVCYDKKVYLNHIADFSQRHKTGMITEEQIKKYPELFSTFLVGLDTQYVEELNKSLNKPIDTDAFEKGEIALFSTDKPELYQLGSELSFINKANAQKTTVKLGGFLPQSTPFKGGIRIAPNIFISNAKMRELYDNPLVYSITMDTEDKLQEKIYSQLKEIIGGDKEISLDSRLDMLEQYKSTKLLLYVLGSGMSLILALIGILNFVNVIVTSINARRHEFAVLESIGMDSERLRRILLFEGGAYALISGILVLVFGNGISYGLFTLFRTEATYAVFTFPFIPLLICLLVIFAVCLSVPGVAYKSLCKESITERLRSIEG